MKATSTFAHIIARAFTYIVWLDFKYFLEPSTEYNSFENISI